MKKLLYILLLLPVLVNAQIIVTVAGDGTLGYSGDGGPATAAKVYSPDGVAFDNSGNLYICDNKCIRKVSPPFSGIITTVAGNGMAAGYSGDGGPAIYAHVNGVHDIAIDKYGNLYLPDAGNNRVRKVTPDGIMRTIAGTGTAGYNGDGIAATAAQLNSPYGITIDDTGNIYIGDSYNYRIRKINTSGIISTIAGTGLIGFSPDGSRADTAKFNNFGSIRMNRYGEIYFADNIRIRKIDLSGSIVTVAGNGIGGYSGDGGVATAAHIAGGAIALDTAGNLYIAEGANNRIRKVSGEGTISTIAGNGMGGYGGDGGNPLYANLSSPQGVVVANTGDVYIGDGGNSRVRMVTNKPIKVTNQVPMQEAGIVAYPNPACNELTVQIAEVIKSVSIVNMAGQVYVLPPAVPRGDRKVGVAVLDISALPVGGYMVLVNGVYGRMFVKE